MTGVRLGDEAISPFRVSSLEVDSASRPSSPAALLRLPRDSASSPEAPLTMLLALLDVWKAELIVLKAPAGIKPINDTNASVTHKCSTATEMKALTIACEWMCAARGGGHGVISHYSTMKKILLFPNAFQPFLQ